MASKKTYFLKLKNLKRPKVRGFLIFLVKFYTDHIKFHILIVICEFCYIFTENALTESELCIGCSSWVEILCPVSVLLLH